MTTPAVPPTEPNAGPPRETLPPPVDPFIEAFGQPPDPDGPIPEDD